MYVDPGWYPDPWLRGGWRWWDGYRWSDATGQTHGATSIERRWFPDIGRFPPIAGVVMYLALVVTVAVDRIASVTGSRVTQLILGLASLGLSVFAAPGLSLLVSYRWGTRRYVRDIGLRFHWWDLLLGPALAIVAWIVTVVVSIVLQAAGVPSGTNTDGLKESVDQGGAIAVALIVALAVVLAPITEEIALRGVVMKALRSRMGNVAAIGVQGVMFGALHWLPSLGWENVGLITVLSITGIVFGLGAWMTGRIGTTIIAHAIFNGSQIALLLLTDLK